MIHRHLDPQGFSAAAIDDIVARGRQTDWLVLRQALRENAALAAKVEQVCRPRLDDPTAQRYHFWMHYVRALRAAA